MTIHSQKIKSRVLSVARTAVMRHKKTAVAAHIFLSLARNMNAIHRMQLIADGLYYV